MNKKINFRYGQLIYNIYSLLFDEEEIKPKGPNDVKHMAFGRIYYQLAEHPWKAIGITKNLLKELEQNNFDRKNIPITRSHVYERKDFLRKIFEGKNKMTKDELLAFLWEKDITIMSLEHENRHIDKAIDKRTPTSENNKSGKEISKGCYLFTPQDFENFFPARQVGWKYTKEVVERLRAFNKIKDKQEIRSNNKDKNLWEITTKWY